MMASEKILIGTKIKGQERKKVPAFYLFLSRMALLIKHQDMVKHHPQALMLAT